MNAPLETIEVETGPQPEATLIWMHGLGADAHDFEPVVPQLAAASGRALRFVFPNAPVRPITVNGGARMRAWFDIRGLGAEDDVVDAAGMRASAAAISALIEAENQRGVAAERIVLAGFSQGAALAVFTGLRHPQRLAGLMCLSGFAPLAHTLDAEGHAANRHTPLFMAHGDADPVVPIGLAERLRAVLEARGHPVEWRSYPMPHSVSMEEIQAIGLWLRGVPPR